MSVANQALLDHFDRLLASIPRAAIFQTYPNLDSRNFSEVLREVEPKLESGDNRSEERLVWIFAQLELGSIPISALSGPLEEVLPKLSDQADEKLFAAQLLARFSRKLTEKSQTRLAVVMLEQCRDILFATTEGRSRSALPLLECLSGVISEELNRAELRKEKPAALAALREKLDSTNQSLREEQKQKPAPQISTPLLGAMKKARVQRSAKGILESALAQATPVASTTSVPAIAEEAPQAWANPLDQDLHLEHERPTRDVALADLSEMPRSHREKMRFLRFGSAAVVLIGIYLVLRVSLPKPSVELEDARLAMTIDPVVVAELKLPDPNKTVVDISGENSSLKDLTRRLENLKESQHSDTPSAEVRSEQPAATPVIPVRDPMEPRMPAEPEMRDPVRARDRAKLPEMDTDRLSQAVLESLGQAPGMVPPISDSPMVVGPDGRTYGRPLPRAGEGNGRALDGSPLREYPVDQLPSPELYRIIVPTKVLSAPSVVAVALGELRRDSVIQVVSKMGMWLEIRSTGGRRGFVYAQDAAPSTQ